MFISLDIPARNRWWVALLINCSLYRADYPRAFDKQTRARLSSFQNGDDLIFCLGH